MELRIYGALSIYKRLHPTDGAEQIIVARLSNNIISFGRAKGDLEISLTIEELRAIMRLFDTGSSSDSERK